MPVNIINLLKMINVKASQAETAAMALDGGDAA